MTASTFTAFTSPSFLSYIACWGIFLCELLSRSDALHHFFFPVAAWTTITLTVGYRAMRKTLENRLQDLYSKRDGLDQRIKQIEKEKAAELRKRQTKRERLVGRTIYALVASGEWTEGQLRELMDRSLTRASERQLFGLPVSKAEDKAHQSSASDPSVVHLATKQAAATQTSKRQQRTATAAILATTEEAKPAPSPSSSPASPGRSRRLPESSPQEALMEEFNL